MATKVNVKSILADPAIKLALEAIVADMTAVYAAGVAGVDTLDLRVKYTALLADCTDLRTKHTALLADVVAHRASIVGITAKLDADAGVTDTNYAATWNPAATSSTALTAATATAVAASQPGVPTGAQALVL